MDDDDVHVTVYPSWVDWLYIDVGFNLFHYSL